MSDDEWEWDDPSIPDEEILYRSVLARPDFIVPDLAGGPGKPTAAALQWDAGDGISTYRKSKLEALNVEASAVKRNPDDHVFAFPVESPRRAKAGVVDDDDVDDPVKGEAHAVVRCSEVNPSKPRKREIREQIVEDCWKVL